MLQSMRSIHFNANGFDWTYRDFYVGFGLFVTVLMLLAAVLTWQLGGLPPRAIAGMRIMAWGLVVCFGAVTYLSYRFFL